MHAKTQESRYAIGDYPMSGMGQIVQVLRRAPPQPSRLNTRPVVKDRWGFGTLADANQGRIIGPIEEKGTSPVILAVVGFLGYRLLFG